MVPLAGCPAPLGFSRCVNGGGITQDRSGGRGSVADVVEGAGGIYFSGSEAQAVVLEGVVGAAGIIDAGNAIRVVVRERCGLPAGSDGRAVPIIVILVRLATGARQLVVEVIRIALGDIVEDLGQPVSIAIVGVRDGVGRDQGPRLAGELVRAIVTEIGDGAVIVRSTGYVGGSKACGVQLSRCLGDKVLPILRRNYCLRQAGAAQ